MMMTGLLILQGYLPLEPETLNSKYGTIEELRNCISALHARHLWVLADLVLNHRCAQVKVCAFYAPVLSFYF